MEDNPYCSPSPYTSEASPAPTGFRDQRVGLRIFGSVQIVLGGFFGLGILGACLAMAMVTANASFSWRTLAGGVWVNLLLAIGLIWLGIGSILARRWAWALTLIGSCLSLVVGAVGGVSTALRLPAMLQTNPGKLPSQVLTSITLVTAVVILGMFVGLPLAFAWFYRRPAVRATCYWYDAQTRWTDRCPLPVLGVVVVLGYGVLMIPALALNNCVLPLFGVLVSGPLGGLVLLLLTLLLGYLTWAAYRQQPTAWWGTVLLVLGGAASYAFSFALIDPVAMYTAMGLPAEQIAAMQKMGVVGWASQAGVMLVECAALLVYLFMVRHHFRGQQPLP